MDIFNSTNLKSQTTIVLVVYLLKLKFDQLYIKFE